MSAASASLGAKSNQTGAFRENVPGRFAALNVAVMAYAADLDGLSENPVWSRKSVVAGPGFEPKTVAAELFGKGGCAPPQPALGGSPSRAFGPPSQKNRYFPVPSFIPVGTPIISSC